MTTLPTEQVLGLHHVAYAVADLDEALAGAGVFPGGELHLRRVLEEQGVEAAALRVGDSEIELIRPLSPHSGVGRFLERRGPGMHHVAWAVQDIERTLHALRERGIRLIDERPRPGLHGTPVAFVHPASMLGVLTELVQAEDGGGSDE